MHDDRRISEVIVLNAIATLAITVGALGAGTAHADPTTDMQFLNFLDRKGVTYSSAKDAIALGHTVCTDFRAGWNFMEVLRVVDKTMTPWGSSVGDSGKDDSNLMGASIGAYCPEQHPPRPMPGD